MNGDLDALGSLVTADPALVRATSNRRHHATLLHYVAANGVEDFRQRTPANIVDVTRFLLDAGAEVDAPNDDYGGGGTALGLVATAEDVLIATVDAGEDTDVALFAIENETGIVAVAPEVADFDPLEATLLYLRIDTPAAGE